MQKILNYDHQPPQNSQAYSKTNFSLQCKQFVKQTCKEGDNGELGGMVSMDHQILETQIKRNMGQLLRRICILILKFKGLVCLFDPESLGQLQWSSVQTEWNSFDLRLQTIQYSCLHQTEWNLRTERQKINKSEKHVHIVCGVAK